MQIILTEEEYNALKKASDVDGAAKKLAEEKVGKWVVKAIPIFVDSFHHFRSREDVILVLRKISIE